MVGLANIAPTMKIRRSGLPKISEEMKAWSAALASELATWPKVASKSFFGYDAFYRGDRIFALLPDKRGLDAPNAIAFKLPASKARLLARARRDSRVSLPESKQGTWLAFELNSAKDLKAALEWLQAAYQAAR